MGLTRLFGEVRPGEGKKVALLTLNLFIGLFCYYLIKTVREPLILATGGAELKTYASAVQAVALMGAVPLYSWLTGRFSREKSIRYLLLFFIGCIEVFFVLGKAELPLLGFVFYVWVGIFSLVLIAQFWSFANDLMSPEQGKRLFPIVGIGAATGSWLGATAAGALFDAGISAFSMMQIAAGLLLLHLALYRSVEKQSEVGLGPGNDADLKAALQEGIQGEGGFQLLFKSRYITLIAVLLLVLNVVNTLGEYILSDAIRAAADAAFATSGEPDRGAFMERYIGGTYGSFFAVVNAAGFVLQAFVASRLVKWGGLKAVLIALPIVALGTYGLAIFGVGLTVFRWAKTAENATDYSIMNTAKAMLWLPTSREEKYRAKQAVDTVFVRVGDLLAALVVFVGLQMGFGSRQFSAVNLVVIGLWFALALTLAKRYQKLSVEQDSSLQN